MARGDREKVIAMNQTNDGWRLGSSSSNEQRICLRDIEVVEMVNTLKIFWLEKLNEWWCHLQNKGIYRKRQVWKENSKSGHKFDKQVKTSVNS